MQLRMLRLNNWLYFEVSIHPLVDRSLTIILKDLSREDHVVGLVIVDKPRPDGITP